jgi:hypothetical protein
MDLQNVGVWGFTSKNLLSLWRWRSATDHITCFDCSADEVKVLIGTEEGKVGWYNYACGFHMYSLRHKKGCVAVNAVLVLTDVAPNLPEVGIAAVGHSLLSWPSNNLDMDVKTPSEMFEHTDQDALAMCLAIVDHARQFIACGFSNSELQIFTYSLTPIFKLVVNLPVEHMCCVTRGAFLGTHNDGYVTMFGLDPRSYDVHALFSVQCSHVEDEHVTCLAVQETLLIVGDNLGVVSIFDFGDLLDQAFLKREILAALQEAAPTKVIQAAVRNIKLNAAFDVHEGAVTGLSIVHGNEIITSGGDRHLRSWSMASQTLVTEYGMHDPNMQPFFSFNVRAEHAFFRRKITRALSFTKRGSVLGIELRKKRLAKLENKQAVKEAKPKKLPPTSVTGLGLPASLEAQQSKTMAEMSSSTTDDDDDDDVLLDPISGMRDFLSNRARFSSFVFGSPNKSNELAEPHQAKTPQPVKQKTTSSLGKHLGFSTPPPITRSPSDTKVTIIGDGVEISQQQLPKPEKKALTRKFSGGMNVSPSIRLAPQTLPQLPMLNYQKPAEMDLFKLATDRVIKLRHSLTRVIPDVSTHQKLQEVTRIREERLNEKVKSGGIFYRLDMLDVRAVVQDVQQSTSSPLGSSLAGTTSRFPMLNGNKGGAADLAVRESRFSRLLASVASSDSEEDCADEYEDL